MRCDDGGRGLRGDHLVTLTHTDNTMTQLQRKIKQIKEKLKLKMMRQTEPQTELTETPEMQCDTTDFVWVGGFQSKTTVRTPAKTAKRKLSFTEDNQQSEREEEDQPLESSPATIELQMAWYKNFRIRFFEDDVASPAKRSRRHSKEGRKEQVTSTPILGCEMKSFNKVQKEINTFKTFFEPGPDFKIYDDYYYPSLPSPQADYRNLQPGNTPAPPLPPRNEKVTLPPVLRAFKQRQPRPPPTLVFRSYRPTELSAARKTLRFELNFNDHQFGMTKAFSTECLNYSLLL